MISDEQLTEWELLANEATPGPWAIGKYGGGVVRVGHELRDVATRCNRDEDTAFIAVAREAVPALIAEVRKLAKLSSEYFAQAEQYDVDANLLAKNLSAIYGCWNDDKVYCIDAELSDDENICIKCWRKHICEAARKAFEDGSHD